MLEEPAAKKEHLRVILDSNALFASLKFKMDVLEELKTLLKRNFKPIILSPVKRELERLAENGSPKRRKEAAYALTIAQKCEIVEVDELFDSSPDDAIVRIAGEWKCPVFTNDRELRKRLRNISVPVIYVRQRSRLEIDGRI